MEAVLGVMMMNSWVVVQPNLRSKSTTLQEGIAVSSLVQVCLGLGQRGY